MVIGVLLAFASGLLAQGAVYCRAVKELKSEGVKELKN